MDGKQLYEENFELIDQLVRRAVRRLGMHGADADDLIQEVHLRLIEDDYRRLNGFRGESALGTFLHQVVHSTLSDLKRKENGRLDRPSAKARRLGVAAEHLEMLLRKGYSLDEAIRIVRQEVYGRNVDLEAIAAQLPGRNLRKHIPQEKAPDLPAPPEDAMRRTLEGARGKVQATLSSYVESQSDEDRFLLRQVFCGAKISNIARSLGLPTQPNPLYRRLEKHLRTLRTLFEAVGVSWHQVQDLLEWPDFFLDFGDDGADGPENDS